MVLGRWYRYLTAWGWQPDRVEALNLSRSLLCFSLFIAIASTLPATTILSEDFTSVSALVASGWAVRNNSVPVGDSSWFQGVPAVFGAATGPADSYVAANFAAAGFGGNVSDWLFTPPLLIADGDTVTFATRSEGLFGDGLEVRFFAGGDTTNVGSSDSSVGDYAHLALAINPGQADSGYPTSWTAYTATASGLSGVQLGRYAFRYLVSDTSMRGDYIGIDSVVVNSTAVPEPSALPFAGAGLAVTFFSMNFRKTFANFAALFAFWRKIPV